MGMPKLGSGVCPSAGQGACLGGMLVGMPIGYALGVLGWSAQGVLWDKLRLGFEMLGSVKTKRLGTSQSFCTIRESFSGNPSESFLM